MIQIIVEDKKTQLFVVNLFVAESMEPLLVVEQTAILVDFGKAEERIVLETAIGQVEIEVSDSQSVVEASEVLIVFGYVEFLIVVEAM